MPCSSCRLGALWAGAGVRFPESALPLLREPGGGLPLCLEHPRLRTLPLIAFVSCPGLVGF